MLSEIIGKCKHSLSFYQCIFVHHKFGQFQILTRQMSIHEETAGVESESTTNSNKNKDKESSEVSWYIDDDETNNGQKEKKEGKNGHPEDRQIDRVGSLGFLYQKSSVDKADVNASCSESAGDQQMLTPAINGVAGHDGNKQPVLAKNSENVKSVGSMDLDNFLLSENSSSAPAAGTSKYSDLHHHALSLDDLEDQNDENESDIPMSEKSTSLVPSLKSTSSSGLVRDDSLEGGDSLLSKGSSDRMSLLSFGSDHSRPISPLSMSDMESLAPLLSPLPPTPEMTYDFEENDFCDNEDTEFSMEPHDSLDTPPLPECAKMVPAEEVLNSKQLKESDQIEAQDDAFVEPIEKKSELLTKPECNDKNMLSKNTSKSSGDVRNGNNYDKTPSGAADETNSVKNLQDANIKELANKHAKSVPIDIGRVKVERGLTQHRKPNNDPKTELVIHDSTKVYDVHDENLNVPGAFIKLGRSTKKTITKSKPFTLTKPEELSKERGPKNPALRSAVVKTETVNQGIEKWKSNLQKPRSKGAKIDDINIVPCRQHSLNPISSRSRRHSSNVIQDPSDQGPAGCSNGAEQTGANNIDNSHTSNSAENFAPGTYTPAEIKPGPETLGPLKQKKRVSRVKSSEHITSSRATVSQSQVVKIEDVKPTKIDRDRTSNVEDAEIPRGKTSDQFKRRTSRFSSSRKVKSSDDPRQLKIGLQGEKEDSTQITAEQIVGKRKRAQSSSSAPTTDEPKTKKVQLSYNMCK